MNQDTNNKQPNEALAGNENKSGIQEKGRIQGSGDPALENENNKRDISYIDQQEGSMNNGALGGNFDAPDTSKA